MKVHFFANAIEFRQWFEKFSETETELLVGFYKVSSRKPSITWSESVDQALCFGWIDSVRRTVDHESYCIRFTPRRANSIWSNINIEKVHSLTASGLMTKKGIAAFNQRKEQLTGIYSHENKYFELDKPCVDLFKSHKDAWCFFEAQAPSYRKVTAHWIMSAKQEKTKLARLHKIIALSLAKQRHF